jgi:hypothetical protein
MPIRKSKYSNLRDPKTLKVGHITKTKQGKYLKVSKDHKYVAASKGEIACDSFFKSKVKRNIAEMKSRKNSRIKSSMQAVAIAYSQTRNKYPRCKKVKA